MRYEESCACVKANKAKLIEKFSAVVNEAPAELDDDGKLEAVKGAFNALEADDVRNFMDGGRLTLSYTVRNCRGIEMLQAAISEFEVTDGDVVEIERGRLHDLLGVEATREHYHYLYN